MNKAYLETLVDNLTVGTHTITQELKDYLNDDYYCEDKLNDNLVIYSINGDNYGLVINNEIIVSDDYDTVYDIFEQISEEIEKLPKSKQLMLEYGLTIEQANEIYQLILCEK